MAKILMKGNEAVAEAAVRGGCRFFAGYPITPQSEIPEYLSARLPEVGGVFIQGESEVASINMVYGAATSGVRAMTGSSGPGISLKAEGISYLSGAMLPAVQFCGLINPVTTLEGFGRFIGSIYPTTYMLLISRGVFNKALNFSDLHVPFFCMLVMVPIILGLGIAVLRKQEV